MKNVYICMSQTDMSPCVFSSKQGAHKWLRMIGLHPIGGRFWATDKEDSEEYHYWVHETKVLR